MEKGGGSRACGPSSTGSGDSGETRSKRFGSLEGSAVLFTGDGTQFLPPCTATETCACQITQHLPALNRYLSKVSLEIREVQRRHTQLAISGTSFPAPGTLVGQEITDFCNLIRFLFTAHHCVTEVDISVGRAEVYHILFCDAMKGNQWIKKIKLHSSLIDDFGPNNTFCVTVLSLTNLEHLEFPRDEDCGGASLYMLSTIIRKSESLKTLRIPFLDMETDEAGMLLTAITERTRSLIELSLNCSIIRRAPVECVVDFAVYLRVRTGLRKLTINGAVLSTDLSVNFVLGALCFNDTIQTLQFRSVSISEKFIALVGRIVQETIALRRLHISPPCHCSFVRQAYQDNWYQALVANVTLLKVTLPVCIMGSHHWAMFFRILPVIPNLYRMTIVGRVPEGFDFGEVCQSMRDIRVRRRVTFGRGIGRSCYRENNGLLYCTSYGHVLASQDVYNADVPLWTFVRQLCSLSNVTSLTLRINPSANNENLSSALVEYIGATSTLKNLSVYTGLFDVPTESSKLSWIAMIESLRRNRSITELLVQTKCMQPGEIEQLADTIRCSQNIRRLTVWQCGTSWSTIFVKRLAERIHHNYSLVSVKFPFFTDAALLPIWETAQRNARFAALVSQFQHGAELESLTGVALERLSRHRALLLEFADAEVITEDEARAAVQDGLKAFEDLNTFMRLAGVVRHRVTCYPVAEGRMQMDDLNKDCWRKIRQHLMLEDVKGRSTQLTFH